MRAVRALAARLRDDDENFASARANAAEEIKRAGEIASATGEASANSSANPLPAPRNPWGYLPSILAAAIQPNPGHAPTPAEAAASKRANSHASTSRPMPACPSP